LGTRVGARRDDERRPRPRARVLAATSVAPSGQSRRHPALESVQDRSAPRRALGPRAGGGRQRGRLRPWRRTLPDRSPWHGACRSERGGHHPALLRGGGDPAPVLTRAERQRPALTTTVVESLTLHHLVAILPRLSALVWLAGAIRGVVVQLVRTPAC